MGIFSFFTKKSSTPTEEDKLNVKKNLDNALKLYEKEKYSEAKVLLEKVIAVDPNIAIAQAKLGGVYIHSDNIKKAKKHLEKAIELDDNLNTAHNNMGIVHITNNNLEKAIKSFEKAYSLSPNDALTIKNLGMCYIETDPKKFYFYMNKAGIAGDKEASQFISDVKEKEINEINSLNISDEDKKHRLIEAKVKYLFLEEGYTEIIERLENYFEKDNKFDLDLMLTYLRVLKKLKEFNKSLNLTLNLIEKFSVYKEQNEFFFLYILAGMLFCHLGNMEQAGKFISIGFQLEQEGSKEFIIEEEDELVRIGENGFPSMKLPENYKEILYKNAKQDQIDRKNKSENILLNNKVKLNENLPLTVSEEDVNLRSIEEICQRILGIVSVALKAEGSEKAFGIFRDKFQPANYFTSREKLFLSSDNKDPGINAEFTWRYECVYVLLWALSYIDNLPNPSKPCDASKLVDVIMKLDNIENFISNSNLRSKSEILDMVDLIYRYDWACVNKRVNSKTPIGDLDPEIVYEWHFAFNWLINFENQDWDNVSTPT